MKTPAHEAEMESRRQELRSGQYWRLRRELAQTEQRPTRPATQKSGTDKVGAQLRFQ